MKVNFISAHSILTAHKTGVQIHDINIIKSLIAMGHDVTIYDCQPKWKYDPQVLTQANDPEILSRVVFSRIPARFARKLPLWMSFGRHAPSRDSICILDSFVPTGIYKDRSYAVIHDLMSMIYPQNYTNRKPYLTYFRQIGSLGGILANSHSTKADYLKFFPCPEEKVHVLPCCIDDDYKKRTQELVSGSEPLYRNYFYYIGDMRANKNLANAIKAFSEFSKRENHADYRFVIAGKKGAAYESLFQTAKDCGCSEKVIFPGYISDAEKANILLNATALVFVSEYEGFGIPVIESMACGVPVITSNTSSMYEIGRDASMTVDPHDVYGIAAAMSQIVDQPDFVAELVEKGYRRAAEYTLAAQQRCFQEIL